MNSIELERISEITIHYKPRHKIALRPKISTSQQVYSLMKQAYYENNINHHEQFWIVLLNAANRVLGICKIGEGGINHVNVDIRIIFQCALKANAVRVILVHNHPSNEVNPSADDKDFTKKAVESGKLLNINIIDHIIVTSSNGYFSFCDEGILL